MTDDIVNGFQNLHVLMCTGSGERMNDLVRDLSIVLPETAEHHNCRTKHDELLPPGGGYRRMTKKHRSRMRRPRVFLKAEGGNMSEASESSLDDIGHDSDGMLEAALTRMSVAQFSCSLPESDSVTENISPNRQHRRRRKFRHMVMDTGAVSGVLKPFARPVPQYDNGLLMPTVCSGSSHGTAFGKRKRTTRDHNLDTEYMSDQKSSCSSCRTEIFSTTSKSRSRHNSSSLSSDSEAEAGQSHGEGGEGDDEQSDYYNESGPAAGSVSWSDMNSDGDVCADSKQHEANVDNVCEMNRPIRSGKRRLGCMRQRYSLSHFMQDRQQWKSMNEVTTRAHAYYSKRPKKSSVAKHDCCDEMDYNYLYPNRNQSPRSGMFKVSQKASSFTHI